MERKTGLLDEGEQLVRLTLGVILVALAWGFGWTSVEGLGALVVGAASFATGLWGYSPADAALAKLER